MATPIQQYICSYKQGWGVGVRGVTYFRADPD